jgi:hypothetical protein
MNNEFFVLLPRRNEVVRDSMENLAINLSLNKNQYIDGFDANITYIMYSTSNPDILPKCIRYRVLKTLGIYIGSRDRHTPRFVADPTSEMLP